MAEEERPRAASRSRSRSRSRSPSKSSKKKPAKKIDKSHPEFELTYDMMLAVRTTVSKVESKPPRELVLEDFTDETKLRFLSGGTADTPAHQMRDFKFKDYAPEVFRHIRAKFGITPTEYLLNLCGDFDLLEFISNSKSGSFFFYTQNGQYLIKTIDKAESKKLRYILPAYYHHVMKYENTLLTRFYGMHRVKPHKRKMVHFLVFGSVFHQALYIHRTFDLKGSSQGRSATPEEKAGGDGCVYKDNDFLEQKAKIRVGPDRAKVLKDQIERDVEFLRQLEIMDYSLLLGVHDGRKAAPAPPAAAAAAAPAAAAAAAAVAPSPKTSPRRRTAGPEFIRTRTAPGFAAAGGAGGAGAAGDADGDADEWRPPQRSLSLSSQERRQSHYGLPAVYDKRSYPEEGHFVAPEFEPLHIPEQKQAEDPIESVFTADDGGIRGCDKDGRPNGEVYYLGVIDILTVYSAKKKVEHFGKSIKYDKTSISCVKPTAYARRFCEFMFDAIE